MNNFSDPDFHNLNEATEFYSRQKRRNFRFFATMIYLLLLLAYTVSSRGEQDLAEVFVNNLIFSFFICFPIIMTICYLYHPTRVQLISFLQKFRNSEKETKENLESFRKILKVNYDELRVKLIAQLKEEEKVELKIDDESRYIDFYYNAILDCCNVYKSARNHFQFSSIFTQLTSKALLTAGTLVSESEKNKFIDFVDKFIKEIDVIIAPSISYYDTHIAESETLILDLK